MELPGTPPACSGTFIPTQWTCYGTAKWRRQSSTVYNPAILSSLARPVASPEACGELYFSKNARRHYETPLHHTRKRGIGEHRCTLHTISNKILPVGRNWLKSSNADRQKQTVGFSFQAPHPIRSHLCLLRGRTAAIPSHGHCKGACVMAAPTNPTNVSPFRYHTRQECLRTAEGGHV